MIAALLLFAILALPAKGALPPEHFADLAFEQKPGAELPRGITLTGSDGRPVALDDLTRGLPSILLLQYFRCPNLCDLVSADLFASLAQMPLTPGRDYRVIAVSIDPREGPRDAAAARERILSGPAPNRAERGWRFLTGDRQDVARIADSVGFRFAWDEATRQYAHGAGVIVLTPGGRVARYLLGLGHDPTTLRLALVDAAGGAISAMADRILLLCYHYDPKTGTYTPAIETALKLAGGATALGLGLVIARQTRRG